MPVACAYLETHLATDNGGNATRIFILLIIKNYESIRERIPFPVVVAVVDEFSVQDKSFMFGRFQST